MPYLTKIVRVAVWVRAKSVQQKERNKVRGNSEYYGVQKVMHNVNHESHFISRYGYDA